jgi:glycine/D-amino acid oxidase-like deaminating enzyme
MKTYDWIVVGGGITGAALSYELAQCGFSVLLVEQYTQLQGASRYSYGGLAYWSGTTPLTRQLCELGITRHRLLSQELDVDTQFREIDLLLTIPAGGNSEVAAAAYSHFAIPPKQLSVAEACDIEPLLDPNAIAGALTVRHGHIQPEVTTQGYIRAFLHVRGVMKVAQVVEFLRKGQQFIGVRTTDEVYYSDRVVICAGGLSRQLLKTAGISIQLYFTHAEIVETPPVDLQLRTLVMPADIERFQLETKSSTPELESLWDEPSHELQPPILDAGAIQFLDRSLRLGQISRVLTDPNAQVDPVASEATIRAGVTQVLPTLGNLPGHWRHCLVGFSGDRLPLIGTVPGYDGIYVFSGFSNPLAIVPPLAQRFARWVSGQDDDIIAQLSPLRFYNGESGERKITRTM